MFWQRRRRPVEGTPPSHLFPSFPIRWAACEQKCIPRTGSALPSTIYPSICLSISLSIYLRSDLGDIQLPSITDSPVPQGPLTTSHDLKPPTPAPSPLTLPPIFLAKSSSLVTAGQDSAENHAQKEEHQSSGSTVDWQLFGGEKVRNCTHSHGCGPCCS